MKIREKLGIIVVLAGFLGSLQAADSQKAGQVSVATGSDVASLSSDAGDSKRAAEENAIQLESQWKDNKKRADAKKVAALQAREKLRKDIAPKIEELLKKGTLPFEGIDLREHIKSPELEEFIHDGYNTGHSLMRCAIVIGDDGLVDKMLALPLSLTCSAWNNRQDTGFSYAKRDAFRFGGVALYEKLVRWALRPDVIQAGFRLDEHEVLEGVPSKGGAKILKEYFTASGKLKILYAGAFQFSWKTHDLQALIEEGAVGVNCCDSEKGMTLLGYAAKRAAEGSEDHLQTVRMLVDHNADIMKKDEQRKMAIEYVSYQRKNAEIVRELRKLLKPNKSIDDIVVGLAAQATDGATNRNVASIIAAYGLFDGEDILDIAITGNCEQLKYLLENGYDANARNVNGKCSLHWAAENGDLDSISCLLAHKANPDAVENHGMCAQIFAAEKGHNEVVQLLLDAKANPNIQTTYNSPVQNRERMRRRRQPEGPRNRYRKSAQGKMETVQEVAGTTGLMMAGLQGNIPLVGIFLAHPKIATKLADKDGKTVLQHVQDSLADADLQAGDRDALTSIKTLLEDHARLDKGDGKSN